MSETLVKIVNSTTSKVSLSSGYLLTAQATIYVPISKFQFDAALCTDLASHITHNHVVAYVNGIQQTADDIATMVSRYTTEEVREHSDFQESVLSRFDPTAALPTTPVDGARYWSKATANGWTINRIYEWMAGTSTWEDTIPTAGTEVYVEADAMLYLWNGSALVTFAAGTRVRAHLTAIDLKALAAYTGAVNGLSTDYFVPTNLTFRVTAAGGAALNGNAQVTVGTSAGGTQILPATPLTGLSTIRTTFSIPIAGLVNVAIAGNSTLHCSVTFADTSAGTGTAELYIEGLIV
jgi:hypothetical protein